MKQTNKSIQSKSKLITILLAYCNVEVGPHIFSAFLGFRCLLNKIFMTVVMLDNYCF